MWWAVFGQVGASPGDSAQTAPPSVDPLLQYGAVGVVALLGLFAVAKLFDRQVKAHEKDIARGDRLEAELREQNKLIQDRLVVELTRATETIAKLATQLPHVPHEPRRR